ncbi:MAG: ABC transporter substrate-binding protein [Candidatus Omnitrophica bacterium]|nr:ABC transporter substrate-binding protein [Candidatus Omnitrophota bacterium]
MAKIQRTVCLLFGMILISSNVWAGEPVIAVVLGKAIGPYLQALSGFETELKENGYQISPHHFDLDEYEGPEERMIQEIRDLKPALIFTIGTKATLFAQGHFQDLPVVFSMVLNPVKAGVIKSFTTPTHNLTGVSLDIPPEKQFEKLKEIQPKVKRVGVIYDAKEKEWIKEIEAVAKKEGLLLVAKPVHSESDVPVALDDIRDKIDALWAQTDAMIYNANSSQYILLTLLRHKIPLMAFSASYVKAGALLALECDYDAIGRQAGRIAIKILMGEDPSTILVSFPEDPNLVVNKRISKLVGIDIPADALKEASEVYE